MLKPIICVAPMMDKTDRHCRYFHRLLAPHTRLYTEMITTHAILRGSVHRHLQFSSLEKYVALQLGGHDPQALAKCAKLGEAYGYDEINLNVGCPSSRVKSGEFGACLMLKPQLVADCVKAMVDVVSIPVTVKCRIGVDAVDDYDSLATFIALNAAAGCHLFIIHARKAWLSGLSPKQNRDIPPLQYDTVYRIKQDFPHLTIIINGGIQTAERANSHCQAVDGVMIGREAYRNPYLLSMIEKHLLTTKKTLTRHEVMHKFIPYIDEQIKNGSKLNVIARHILGLFGGEVGAKAWRRYLSERMHLQDAGPSVIEHALKIVNEEIHD